MGVERFSILSAPCPFVKGLKGIVMKNVMDNMDNFVSMTTLGRYGGFGNQIFQYAALKIYTKENNLDTEVPQNWMGRKLFLDCNDSSISDMPREQREPPNDCIWLNGEKLEGCDIKGYFQYHTSLYDEEYFRSLFRLKPLLEKELRKPVEYLSNKVDSDGIVNKTTLIGVHIRRGDYRVLGRSANMAPTEWYLKWLKENWDKLDNPILFVASDEIDNVILDFKDYKPETFKGDNFLCDHYMLQHCDILLISSSTFSFTAAMLNEQKPQCLRPDFEKRELVSFKPWNSNPGGAVFVKDEQSTSLKLHLGCGMVHLDGYVNMDVIETPAVDLLGDIRQLPYEDNSVEIIESYHVLEHMPVCLHASIDSNYGPKYGALISVLEEWRRVLKENGRIIIEMPDLDKVVEEYCAADELQKEKLLLSIYGSWRNENDADHHRWGANETRLRYILDKAGFRNITFEKPQDYHVTDSPCLRVEAIK